MIDFNTVELALHSWFKNASGLPGNKVIWDDQNGPRPNGVYISISYELDSVGQDWTTITTPINPDELADIQFNVCGTRLMRIRLQCFDGDATRSSSSKSYLSAIASKHRLPSIHDALGQAGIGVRDIGPIQVVSGVLNSHRVEPRSLMTIEVNLSSAVSELGTYITSVCVSDQTEGVDFSVGTSFNPNMEASSSIVLNAFATSSFPTVSANAFATNSIVVSAIATSDALSYFGTASITVSSAATGDLSMPSSNSMETILTAADPMQALIDAMGLTSKPSFMWGGNEAAGATEIGGSGADLTTTGGVTHLQTSTQLGGTLNTTLHTSNTGSVSNSDGTDLNLGTSSFTVVFVYEPTSFSSTYSMIGDRSSDGWQLRSTASGAVDLILDPAVGGLDLISVTGHTVDTGTVVIGKRNVTLAEAHLFTSAGTASKAGATTGDINSGTPACAVGDTATGSSFRGYWGIFAIFKDGAAEVITDTHRANLESYLGF